MTAWFRAFPLAVLCWSSSPAMAGLSDPSAGMTVDFGAGLGVGGQPFRSGLGWTVGVGGWFGKYDESFAIGRHIAFTARIRQDATFGSRGAMLRSAPMLEVTRGVDLLVVGLRAGAAGGAILETPLGGGPTEVGGTVRGFGAVVYRFRPRVGLTLRVDAGVDIIGGRVQPSVGTLLGLTFLAPLKRAEPPAPAP